MPQDILPEDLLSEAGLASQHPKKSEEEMTKIEFIESYRKGDDGDYLYNDNHGELIRCRNCRHRGDDFTATAGDTYCLKYGIIKDLAGFCDKGEKKED